MGQRPVPLLLVSPDDWTGLTQPGTGLPIGPEQLSVPLGATEVELQVRPCSQHMLLTLEEDSAVNITIACLAHAFLGYSER